MTLPAIPGIPQFATLAGGNQPLSIIDTAFSAVENYIEVSIEAFGGAGDGTTDNYTPIQNAFAYLQSVGGGKLRFPHGNYFVNQHIISGGASANGITSFTLSNLNGVVIEGEGSTIQMQGGWTASADYSASGHTYSYNECIGFLFSACTDVTINNLTINGGSATIAKVATAENFSYGVYLQGCYNFSMNNVTVSNYTTDGFAIDLLGPVTAFKVSQFVYATNCKFTLNARNGMSILQCRHAVFIACEFGNQGTASFGVYAPGAGVDIEPNYYPGEGGGGSVNGDEFTGDITFIGCDFASNHGYQFVSSSLIATPYPVNFIGCSFRDTLRDNPQVVPGSAYTSFVSCNFNNVALWPSYGNNSNIVVRASNCDFSSLDPALQVLYFANTSGEFVVDHCDFTFNSPTAHTQYRIFIESPGFTFTSNSIYAAATEYAGSSGQDLIFLLENSFLLSGNRWSTNLAAGGKSFFVPTTGSTVINETFLPLTFINPGNGITTSSVTLSPQSISILQDTASSATLQFGAAAPTTGAQIQGSIVFNLYAAALGEVGWVCVTSGTPGTWKTFGVISA